MVSFSVLKTLVLQLTICSTVFSGTGNDLDGVGLDHGSSEDVLKEQLEDRVKNKRDVKFIDPNLHPEQYPYYFNNHQVEAQLCKLNSSCPYKDALDTGRCWGYENGCSDKASMPGYPVCTKHHQAWARTIEKQEDEFFRIADFGYVKEMLSTMTAYCVPQTEGDSLLECTQYLRHCRVRNLYMDFSNLDSKNSRNRFRQDIFSAGQLGGHCQLQQEALLAESAHRSELQSWYGEMNAYVSLDFRIPSSEHCDIVINKPTYLIKLDAGINMYHHFCDFVNMYISQHINSTFSTDVYIVMWDTSGLSYGDFFKTTWRAFSDHPIIPLREWDGKKVCMREGVFTLLPRMQRGFFYNMPIVPDCSKSGLMRAFSQHVIHRLGIKQQGPLQNKIRVTLLARNTKHRNIVNENQLVKAMKKKKELEVKVVDYSRNMPFLEQLKITHNTDIFIGMHGAGLTHLLFQPDWAVIFEVYNCEDPRCYKDLASLRGIKYITWTRVSKLEKHNETNHPSLGVPHAKFTDYAFDVKEFMRILKTGIDHVKNHPKYLEAQQQQPRDEL
ncbi:EGF domain-specific O-linked N-acetylglucosamine transferase-like isoform X3 [Ptychodera flava]|uniref:EGF domain-specific O-linked N-acetylglucosamine transferase-like isoform X3 n=1 Tax=Ptychodera flava TaxID=63121 RepID=UPI00396AB089